MHPYPKIQSLFKREDNGKLIVGDYSKEEFEYLKDNLWHVTEKIDGTNIRIMWDGERITFNGRSDRAQLPSRLAMKLAGYAENYIPQFKAAFGTTPACLYGEGFGLGIQKGACYIADGVDFVLFDILIGKWWLRQPDVTEIASSIGFRRAPVFNSTTLDKAIEMVNDGFQSYYGPFFAEGVVLRPLCELQCRDGSRLITKLKHSDFQRLSDS